MFYIFTTDEFNKDFSKLSKQEQERIRKILDQLKQQGDQTGKVLAGLSFLREKKFDGKRLYYLIYKEVLVILAIAISDKKTQQATINNILIELADYQQYVFETLRRKGLF